jgi:hypothetical protein
MTVEYDGACSPYVSVRMAWISFGALPCKKKNSRQLVSLMLLKSRAWPDVLPFSLCNKKRHAIGTWTDQSSQRHYRFSPTSGSRSG